MLTIQITKACPLGINGDIRYTGIAFNGDQYYLCYPKCHEVHIFSGDFCPLCQITVCRAFCSLCYDSDECCFWAIAENTYDKIYKLNNELVEIDCIPLNCDYRAGFLTGISTRDCCLLLTWEKATGETSKSASCKPISRCLTFEKNNAIQSFNCQKLIASAADDSQNLSLYDSCGNRELSCFLPCEYQIKDLCLSCCCGTPVIYALALKDCSYSYILEIHIIPFFCGLPSCPNPCPPPSPPCPKPCPPHCKSQGCTDVIESVALIEAALAHVINAEGEKLQKVIAESKDPCELLKVNESVNKTIKSVTSLEQVLLSKLEACTEQRC